jgi:hypothetical protein
MLAWLRSLLSQSRLSEAEGLLTLLLRPDETLLWVKRPSRRVRLEPRERDVFAFSLVMAVVAVIFAALIALSFFVRFRQTAPAATRIIIIAVLIAVVGVNILRFLYVAILRLNHRAYLLTTQRVLWIDLRRRRLLVELDLSTMDMPRLQVFKNGAGTITFGEPLREPSFWGMDDERGKAWARALEITKTPPSLRLLDDANEAFEAVVRARRDAIANEPTR